MSHQVPLLVQLGQESTALSRALGSGDNDLAISVLLQLKADMSPSDFHIMIRKYPLAKVLYCGYCRKLEDTDALEEWFVQEDDFAALASKNFEQAHDTHRLETRMTRLVGAQENWHKAKEDKVGINLVGLSVNETILQLLSQDQQKLAEKVKQEMRMNDRRFAWLRVRSMVQKRQWEDLKKFAKQKRPPLPAAQVIRVVHEKAGDERVVREFLTEEFLTNSSERIDLFAEFGMFVEAANAAFAAKSLESLNALEGVCAGRDDIIRMINSLKSKLLTK